MRTLIHVVVLVVVLAALGAAFARAIDIEFADPKAVVIA